MDLPPFLFLLLLLNISTYAHLAKSRPHNNITDLESLLAFKADVADPLGVLSSNWTANTSFCGWMGVTCSQRHQRVTALNLYNITLQGTISPSIGNLSFLSLLALGNAALSGPIPESLTHLPRLQTLVLERNYLSGSIPPNLFNTSSLTEIYLDTNKLSGYLPVLNKQSSSSSAIPPPLQVISIGDNQLTGQLSSFAHFLNLQGLSLMDNSLSGSVPADLGHLQQLRWLYLTNSNLSGNIPPSLGHLTKLNGLALSLNNFEGEIPEELGNLSNLQALALVENNLTGRIPPALLNLSMINIFEFALNSLTGSMPPTLGQSLPLLTNLYIAGNQLSGSLDFITSLSNCHSLQRLELSENEFDGFLPDSVGNLSTSLASFAVEENHVKGNIPATIGNLSGLVLLYLGDNEIIGAIPPSLAKLRMLQQLFLITSQISGSIPIELGLLTSLSTLVLSSNKLSGAIPDSLRNLTGLQYLSLSSNALSSKIPQSLWSLRNLIELDLSQNSLHGSIPPEVGNLNMLNKLDLSENRFSGNITSSLGELQMIVYLDLSKNSFMGEIPQSFGGLISLKYLNLSNNFLSGDIPKTIANLRYLEILNLSFNMLAGQIPQGRVFSNLTIPSLEGNKGLCGAPQLKFSPCSGRIVGYTSRTKLHLLQYILPIISVLVVLSCLFLIFIIHRRRKTSTLAATDVQPLGEHRMVSYHDLARATNKFSEENLLGKGSFGSVYRGRLDDGLIVAVKILNMEVEGATKSFHAECEALSSVRHRNLIKIISVCSSLDFKAIVLQFMPNGSLEQWLYSGNYYLNLLQRLNIMVDVSSALEYLHHYHHDVILHCDLKPSNILFDEEMVAHVSDFGIAKLLLGNGRSIASASTPGTIGYIAPEYGSTGNVSKMGDVYTFGILLLETFIGKKPTDLVFDGESSFRECISNAYPSIFDIVDDNIFKGGSLVERQSEDQTAMRHCVLSVIELGLLCTNYSPRERISMINVVARLNRIKVEYLSQLSTS